MMQQNTQASNITTNFKVEVEFNLPAISANSAVKLKCRVDESAKWRWDMLLGRDIII